jgi:hypothetical protein
MVEIGLKTINGLFGMASTDKALAMLTSLPSPVQTNESDQRSKRSGATRPTDAKKSLSRRSAATLVLSKKALIALSVDMGHCRWRR